MKIPSLHSCLINGNPEILIHLTLHNVDLIHDDRMTRLDDFSCLVK